MGVLIDGKWTHEAYARDPDGRFLRQPTAFHGRITADGSSGHPAHAGRYHVYTSYACPWATRVLILRSVKGLQRAISVSVTDPLMGEDGWTFGSDPDGTPDTVNGARLLRDVYVKAKRDFTGRVTVPVLWDKERGVIVNNESREIMRMLDTELDAVAERKLTLYPLGYRDEVDGLLDAIYGPVNNGVYRAGFAGSQAAYDEAVTELFAALDHWDQVLGGQRYLCGPVLTEADVAMFTTLFRFDHVYHTHFKCNIRRLVDYRNLWGYARELYQLPGFGESCHVRHIKEHYFRSHKQISPSGIVPLGPAMDFTEPHDRYRLPGGPPEGMR